MNNSELATELKEYLDEKSISTKEIELPKNKDEELTLQQVKANPVLFSDFFIVVFSEFRRNFKNFDSSDEDKEEYKKKLEIKKLVDKLIQDNEKICRELLDLKSYTLRKIDYGKGKAIRLLNNYVNLNYFEMNDFVDICAEVYL